MKSSLNLNTAATRSLPIFTQLVLESEQLRDLLARFGVASPATTEHSLDKFCLLDIDSQLAIVAIIRDYKILLETELATSTDVIISNQQVEQQRLLRAIDYLGLKLADKSILASINEGDVIEVYDAKSGRQIYRNLIFCKISSYNLLDVAVNSWDELYTRPSVIMKIMKEKIQQLMETPVLTMPYEVEPYILQEKLEYSVHQKTFLMNMKLMSAVVDQSEQKVAVLSILRAKIIADSINSKAFKIL